jgi:ABC-type Fe3+/spermidine/putrescine transport system ATPase subunit
MANIKLQNISKKFDTTIVLENIDLDIKNGQFISILGASGAGKSTLLKIIAGLQKPDSGEIIFDDTNFNDLVANKRNAVLLFQDFRLFPHLSVFENIEFGLKVRKVAKDERTKKVQAMIKAAKLLGKQNHFPNQLSGGEAQRCALARACILNPNVLLLDEPFSNLDTNLKNDLRIFIADFVKQFNITTILVTHDKQDAFILSDKIAILIDKKIAQYDSPQNIYDNPISKPVSDFLGETNYISCKNQNGKFIQVRAPYNSITFVTDKTTIPCQIQTKTYLGTKTIYQVKAFKTVLTFYSQDNDYEVGDNAYIKINLKGSGGIYYEAGFRVN